MALNSDDLSLIGIDIYRIKAFPVQNSTNSYGIIVKFRGTKENRLNHWANKFI